MHYAVGGTTILRSKVPGGNYMTIRTEPERKNQFRLIGRRYPLGVLIVSLAKGKAMTPNNMINIQRHVYYHGIWHSSNGYNVNRRL